MIKPYELPAKAIKTITDRIEDEQRAFYFYLSAAAWCRLNGYECSARYFEVEMHGEEYHYKDLIMFLANWNSPVDFKPILDPVKTFSNLVDILEQAYNMELKLMGKYEDCSKEMFNVCQTTYLKVQDYIRTQNFAVIEADQYLKKVYEFQKTDPGLMLFDKEVFGQYSSLYY